jgi:hypothetical protein
MFVECLLADETFNPTKAARAAGYKAPAAAGYNLIHNKTIAAIIGKSVRERLERVQLNGDNVLEHVTTALFLDPMELFESVGGGVFTVRNLDEIPLPIRRCITKLKCRTRVSLEGDTEACIEIELMSKDALVPIVMKHLGLLTAEGNAVSVNVGLDIVSALLTQVEGERRVIDTKFIEAK